MNILYKAAASLAALTLLAGAPVLAFAADPPTSAIAVEGFDFQPVTDEGEQPGVITITFKNTSDVPATAVTFDIVSDGQVVDSFTDTGTFAPGVTIKHNFDTLPEYDGGNASQVQVESVQFATN